MRDLGFPWIFGIFGNDRFVSLGTRIFGNGGFGDPGILGISGNGDLQ